MSRLKFSVYGNCQNEPLSQILQFSTQFSQIYEEVHIRAVHLISQDNSEDEEEKVHEIVRNLDLFIYQPVSATFGGKRGKLGTELLLTRLKGNARAISFPGAYFTGYNPETIILRDENGIGVNDSFCDYHDLNILKAYHHGMSWQECVSYIQESSIYTSEVLETNLADSLGRLRERERVTDVTQSAFIEKNWRKQRLFFNCNHCSNLLLMYEANQILHLLGLPSLDPAILEARSEYLGDPRLFIYGDVRKHFALRFPAEAMQVYGRIFTFDDAVRAYFDYYSTHPQLVQHNIDFYSRSSDATLSRIASYWKMPSLDKDAQIRYLTLSLEEKRRRITNLQSELDMIRSSTTWRAARKLHPIINRVLPLGTRRRHFVRQTLKAVVRPILKLWRLVTRRGTRLSNK